MTLIEKIEGWCYRAQELHHAIKYAITPGWVWCVECGVWERDENGSFERIQEVA